MNKQSLVTEFMTLFNQPVRTVPTIPPPEEITLRTRLIMEEFTELSDALYHGNIIEVADALADLLYVVYGTACSCGININPIFSEVHRSNMSKVGGKIDEYGKLLKPPTYSAPIIVNLLIKSVRESNWERKDTDFSICRHFENIDYGIECTATNCPCDLYQIE